ncbi:MAG TPA: tRNA pseudouridine(38-40) synthase TruA [Acidiferrobacterales bacterium]|nr:tRNA pseudouridine(38-40) synthase TruA [Acidiferrobacterales bacterium]
MRIAAIIEYDGSRFSGWQWQDGARTVQDCVEQALSSVADEPIRVTVAGRTDAGVHACGQVIHFDTNSARTPYAWVRGANSNLPVDAALLWAHEINLDFHARFSATGRHYRYVILNRAVRPTTWAKRVTWEYRPLDAERMQAAAKMLIGTHDFTSFRAIQCQAKNPVRELRRLEVERRGELIFISAYANAFLHHMVRNLAGVLMTIGTGEQPPAWAHEVLQARDRTLSGVTASPDGLYLTAVEYPDIYEIPRLSQACGLW